ncbi:FAD-dependent oxidoreductase [Nocardioides yefusunii]|uniref:FAD-binding protein n=1 Tax=Nocardioides yefusunii TaxID=2500546 RepID=A0ABW1QWT3_9ACTN|nr:FAD-binding protein [Nocardioides yefusunii]
MSLAEASGVAGASRVVVVVGTGGGGLATALEASAGGALVHLVEKQDEMGGMLHIANGEFSGAGTRRQAAHGIEDSTERHLGEVRRISHDRIREDLAGLSVTHQGETVDWLDDLGFEFHPDCPGLIHGHEVYEVPRTYWGVEHGRSVLKVLLPLVQEQVDAGRIVLHLGTRMTQLVAQEGRVVGIEVENSDGLQVLRGDTVVLATGGYDANVALRNEFMPEHCADVIVGCLDHAQGEGLLAARELGADVTRDGIFLPVMGQIPDPARPDHAVDYRVAFVEMAPAYRTPHEIWVNSEGRRFVAEDTRSPEIRERQLIQQPGNLMHVVFDSRVLETAPVSLIRNPSDDWTPQRFAQACETSPWITAADSPAELADALGVPADALAQEIAGFNADVAAWADTGAADQFGRTTFPGTLEGPRWYAITTVASSILSRDGLVTDADLRVLRADGSVIEGLRAVGEVIGNNAFAGDNYVGGMSVTPAMTLGRLLGRSLASGQPHLADVDLTSAPSNPTGA